MRASVHAFISADVDIDSYVSLDPENDAVAVQMLIGPAGEASEESFDVLVCTPGWLRADVIENGPRIGRHLLIIEPFDLRFACDFLRARVESMVASDWEELGGQIARLGYWEFEDYRP